MAVTGLAVANQGLREADLFRDPLFETEPPSLPELRRPAMPVFLKTNAHILRAY